MEKSAHSSSPTPDYADGLKPSFVVQEATEYAEGETEGKAPPPAFMTGVITDFGSRIWHRYTRVEVAAHPVHCFGWHYRYWSLLGYW